MWHVYNLMAVGDSIRASTFRKITTEGNTGTRQSQKIRLTLTIKIEDIDFDTQACLLRIKGRNIEENEHVKMGAYHTIDVEANRKFTLSKVEWDTVSLERVDEATDPSKNADVAAVVMQEGLANLVLISGSLTLTRAKIDISVPRKRRAAVQQHEKALNRFFDHIVTAILRHINFDIVKCILIGNFLKEEKLVKLVKLCLHSSFTVQNNFYFDEIFSYSFTRLYKRPIFRVHDQLGQQIPRRRQSSIRKQRQIYIGPCLIRIQTFFERSAPRSRLTIPTCRYQSY